MTLRLAPLLLAAAVAAGPAVAGEVKAPHWGDALFHFYQDRHFDAVTTLMASQHFARLPTHDDEAEALRGGLLLSYGLHRDADAIFTRLAEQGTTPAMRHRAWFFLAKIRWQRGLAAEAEQALARIQAPLPPALEEERVLLAAQLRIAAADYAGAAGLLGQIAADGKGSPYARFNLGVALVRSGDSAGGAQWLAGLGTMPAPGEEQRSLRDKANLALGFAALQAEQPGEARQHLERIRLQGPYANKALLGFGWAAAALKQPESALVPWLELAGRDASDPAVLEARIAVPYALAELKAYGQAHEGYVKAIADYERESVALDESVAAVRAGKLIDTLLEHNPGADLGWLWRVQELPQMPHPAHLAPLLATHGFQEALRDQRDLRFLLSNLRHWAQNLQVYGDMLANRRQGYAERLPKVLADSSQTLIGPLRARHDALAATLAEADRQNDGVALADARERALMARLDGVHAALATLPADARSEAARERARLVAGALTWQQARAQPARAWSARKALREIGAQLDAAQRRSLALATAQRDEPQRFDRFDARIAALAQRLQAQIPRVAALQGEQQLALQELAVTALLTQKSRIAEYGAQARFAVAQLQDRATLSKAEEHASTR